MLARPQSSWKIFTKSFQRICIDAISVACSGTIRPLLHFIASYPPWKGFGLSCLDIVTWPLKQHACLSILWKLDIFFGQGIAVWLHLCVPRSSARQTEARYSKVTCNTEQGCGTWCDEVTARWNALARCAMASLWSPLLRGRNAR